MQQASQALMHQLGPSPGGHLWQLWTVSIDGSSDSARLTLSMAMSVHVRIRCSVIFHFVKILACINGCVCSTLPTDVAPGTRQPKKGIDFDASILSFPLRRPQATLKLWVVRRGSLSRKKTRTTFYNTGLYRCLILCRSYIASSHETF